MKKTLIPAFAFAAGIFPATVLSATGEYWEVTSKMEMPGMPFTMPANTFKACIPKGGESDPQRTQGKDGKCTFTDVQHSGNTVKYKGTCVNSRGDTMNMTGETTHDSNSFKTRMEMSAESGKRQGNSMTMKMTSSGKRVGGSCDAEEMAKKTQAQAQEQKQRVEKMQKDALANACDISDPNKLLKSESYYAGASPLCSNKKEYCNAVREKARRDTGFFRDMVSQEKMRKKYASQGVKKTEEVSVINICSLDMASLGKAVCKNSVHRGPQDFLDENCSPAEAKEYREFSRKRAASDQPASDHGDCEGRDYTSPEQREACRNLAKCGSDTCDSTEDKSGVGGINSSTMLDGAKKLKGLFGF